MPDKHKQSDIARKESIKKALDVANARRISFYPAPNLHSMIIADASLNQKSKSQFVENIIHQHYKCLPESEKKNLLAYFSDLTDKEKKQPKSKHNY